MSLTVKKHLVCNDGTTLSVQASKYHYSTPRTNEGPWTHFETYPPINPESDDIVSGYVSEKEIWDYINAHGGLNLSALIKSLTSVY